MEGNGSDRVGVRIVVEIKRDAVAKVVLNNLYKHTQLQASFGANMLAIVDGVPRTLRLDQMIRHYVEHQLDVIIRRTTYRLRKANERAHILRGLVKALDALDEVIALIRASGVATSVACPWPFPESKVYDPQAYYEKAGQPGPFFPGMMDGWQTAQQGRPVVVPPPHGGRCSR